MTPTRPYLVRAFYEWITDNNLTPYLFVNAEAPGAAVPRQFVREGHITLNINPAAVRDLQLGNEWISFQARFGGVSRTLHIPISAVLAIYAHENGQGMSFAEEPVENTQSPSATTPPPEPDKPAPKRPSLKIVK